MAPFARKIGKRKRDDTNEDEENVVKTIQGKLHHGLKEVKHAAKKAKAFEIRRIIKRLKQLKKQPSQSSEIQRVETKLELLKALDHDRLAHSALYTKLHKDHLAKNAHILQASSSILTPPSYTSPTEPDSKSSSSVTDAAIRTKLESRVLSSKTLATEVKTILDHLRRIVEPLGPSSKKMSGTYDDAGDEDEEAEEDAEDEDGDDSETSKRITATRSDPHASESDEDSSAYDDDELKQGHGGLPRGSPEASQPDNEVSNADDAGWESGSISPTSPKRSKLGHSATPSETRESTDEDEEDVQSNDTSGSDEVLTSSHFLPSLNVGFTRGESDGSEWSGAEDDANAADGKQRKNRRGQRARQAIWEKKYGKNANHIKHQHEQERALAEAQALAARAKRGGIARGRGRGGAVGSGIPKHLDGGWKGGAENAKARVETGAGGTPVPKEGLPRAGKGGKKETGAAPGALHPSWEAKRKMKEKEKVAIVPAQGKKIKFS